MSRTSFVLTLAVLLAGRGAWAAEPTPTPPPPPRASLLPVVVIGATGLALSGGYLAGAFATGDRPSGFGLGVTGGVVAGGLLGVGVGLALTAGREDPGSLATFILRPVLGGIAGALVGGLLAGLGSAQPGAGRTATHGVVIGLLLTETVVAAIFSR
ncbi:MAG: hypothetical protein ACOZQL_04215 [Myxococcota bacterium]